MKATKVGKCVVCGTKVREVREFLPQVSLFESVPTGITTAMSKQIIAWRDVPIVCEPHKLEYIVKVRS